LEMMPAVRWWRGMRFGLEWRGVVGDGCGVEWRRGG